MKKIVLAYSGGLDTSIILKWLQENYNAEIIAYTSDIGQVMNKKKIIRNAKNLGVKKIIIENLKNIFVKDFVFPMIRAHAVYEGVYLLGTSIARPLIAKRQIAIAKKFKAFAVSHGATGKGNDQIRFELGYAFFGGRKIKVIAPWREWKLQSRTDLINYAKKKNIPIPKDKKGAPPFSVDDNIFHTSTEGKVLENPKNSAPEFIFQRTISPEKASNKKTRIRITFRNGDATSINGKKLKPEKLLEKLNILAGKNGIGRVDLVENRFIGIKSRGVYETPGGTILLAAHRAIESMILDGPSICLKDEIMPKYAKVIYDGLWFSKERKMMQALIDASQESITGDVKIFLRQGNLDILGRRSRNSRYNKALSTFEEDSIYDQKDANGYIKLKSLRFRN